MEREGREKEKSYPSLPSNKSYEAAPRRTRTKTSAMAKATSARPATSSKVEPPLLGSCCVLALAVGLVIALAVELVAIAEPLEEALTEPLAEALAEPLGEALGEALAVGLAEPLEEALAEALAPLTVTVAVI
jgi:hypothetical protein